MASLFEALMARRAQRTPFAQVGAAPQLIQAPDVQDDNFGESFVQGLQAGSGMMQQKRTQDFAERQYNDKLLAQEAQLAKLQEQEEFARQSLFDAVASGQADEGYLHQFDAAGGPEAKLAIAQQALDPTGGIDPTKAFEAQLQAEQAMAEQEAAAQQFAQEQQLEQARLGHSVEMDQARLGLDQGRLGLDQAGLDQERELALAELAQQQEQAAADRVLDRQRMRPEDIRALEEVGAEPTLENLERLSTARAAKTIEAPKPPSGYQFTDPNNPAAGLSPIKGGPADPDNPKNRTGEQRKAENFHSRAMAAQEKIGAMEAAGFNPADPMARAGEAIGGRFMMSDDAKAYRDYQDEFVRVILRKDTGAAVTADERAEYSNYFPQLGDSAEDVARKAQIRDQVIQGIATEAGIQPASSPAGRASAGKPSENDPLGLR